MHSGICRAECYSRPQQFTLPRHAEWPVEISARIRKWTVKFSVRDDLKVLGMTEPINVATNRCTQFMYVLCLPTYRQRKQ